MKKALLFCFSLLLFFSAQSQTEDDDLIQFSGVVVTRDSLAPVPFATILVKNTSRGTTSDYYGYFSFVAPDHLKEHPEIQQYVEWKVESRIGFGPDDP